MSSLSRIKVIGVGGGGCNAVNRMIEFGVSNVDFIAINTDAQALENSKAPVRLQIGNRITGGKGAGAQPEIGKRAAEESKAALEEMLNDTDMVFVTAGMGGGTGTGAAPVVAGLSKAKGILTVAVVTTPFGFEGARRMNNANDGIGDLMQAVDTLLIIPNNKLGQILPTDVSWDDSFRYADETLRQAIQGTTDLVMNSGMINLDFADVSAVMKDQGLAHMGVGFGEGDNRVLAAIQQAVSSPLLDTTIDNATGVIINVRGGPDMQLNEVYQAVDLVRQVVDKGANIIFGGGTEPGLQGKILATVIATGFDIPTSNETLRLLVSAKMPKPVPPAQAAARHDLSSVLSYNMSPKAQNAVAGHTTATVRAIDSSAPPVPPPTRVDAEIDTMPAWLKNRRKHDDD